MLINGYFFLIAQVFWKFSLFRYRFLVTIVYTAALAVLPFKPNFRQTFCKWQKITSYLIWKMIESMERLTSKK